MSPSKYGLVIGRQVSDSGAGQPLELKVMLPVVALGTELFPIPVHAVTLPMADIIHASDDDAFTTTELTVPLITVMTWLIASCISGETSRAEPSGFGMLPLASMAWLINS